MIARRSVQFSSSKFVALLVALSVTSPWIAGASSPRSISKQLTVSGRWLSAAAMPGALALNSGNARASAISCAAVGNCTAVGSFGDGAGHDSAFVESQSNSHWNSAVKLNGDATFLANSSVANDVSCPVVSTCSVVGYETDSSGLTQGFVASEVAGVWHPAQSIPGLDALNSANHARATVISCGSGGNCAAGGYFLDASLHYRAFVVNQINGVWKSAIAVPGILSLSNAGNAQVTALSCRARSSCSAGGYINGGSNHQQPFVVTELNGSWGLPVVVVNDASFNAGGKAQITALSCTSVGNCTAGGFYRDKSTNQQPFLMSQVGGNWNAPFDVPGVAALNAANASVTAVSCDAAGGCAVGGFFTGAFGRQQPFLISESAATWSPLTVVSNASNVANNTRAQITAVACDPTGFCGAGGFFTAPGNHVEAFVLGRTNSQWGSSSVLPGSDVLNVGNAALVTALSCPAVGYCAAVGNYQDGSSNAQNFVAVRATSPSAPLQIAAVSSKGSAHVSWKAPTSNGGATITQYVVTSSPLHRTCTSVSVRSCTVKGLLAQHAYSFSVVAVNPVGASVKSAASRVVTVR